ncbi:MAG: DEAD/DEAH box helicase family protein [Bacilli bacterium]|nr:DEAD/DEAH box helicase family protein [Bacilli bacterium]
MVYEAMTKEELLMELYRLREQLTKYEEKYGAMEETDTLPLLDIEYSAKDKTAIYMDYFVGREDAYAERYENANGKKGYSLACKNKWKQERGCDIRNSHCKHCLAYAPKTLDAEAILEHMFDKRKMKGLYPIMEGNYVKLLVFDMDKSSYLEDTKKLCATLRSLSIMPLMERSQSGHGIHVWVFFEEKIKAADVWKIANYVLTKTMDTFGGVGLDSYDRVFPNQDKVEKGGFGNCVALPLNVDFAKEGNTVFLKPDFSVAKEQIKYLSTIRKVSKGKVEELLGFAARMEEHGLLGMKALQMPLSKDDFAPVVHVDIAGDIFIPNLELTSRSERFLIRLTSMPNKEYYKISAIRGNLHNVPRFLCSYKKDERFFRLPRGYKEPLLTLFKAKGIQYVVNTSLTRGEYADFSLGASLREDQATLLERALEHDSAVISAPTGFGKTVLGIALMAKKRVNTLILVPSITLLEQWKSKLIEHLRYEDGDATKCIGYLSGKGDKRTGIVDIATIQSLVRNEDFRQNARKYGMVIVDEVHHLGAVKFEEALRSIAPKYLYGLTATPERSDEREDFVFHAVGPLIEANVDKETGDFIKRYHPRFTKFSSPRGSTDISGLFQEAILDKERNRLIVADVKEAFEAGSTVLLLTEQIKHARILYDLLSPSISSIALVYGAQEKAERKENEDRIAAFGEHPFVVVSIGKYIGEGFDDHRFNALFVTYPFRWKGILAQYCGRLQRKKGAIKHVDVYDYVDSLVPAFSRMYREREKGYFQLGYQVVAPDAKYRSEILSGKDYGDRLFSDLEGAKESVLLTCSYFHEARLRSMMNKLACPYSCYVGAKSPALDSLEAKRVSVELPNMVIIDKRIVYYGGVNPFMYGQKEETILRVEDPAIASDLVSVLAKIVAE